MNDKTKLFILLIVFLCVLIMSICIGSSNISPVVVSKIVSNNLFNTNYLIDSNAQSIIWFIRIPRILVGAVSGFSLAVCGLVMQSLLKNPIATPYTLGVSTGASLGVSIPIFFGITLPYLSSFTYSFFGFIGALFSMGLVILVVDKFDKTMDNINIIVVGMIMSMTLSGVLAVLTAMHKDKAQIFVFWQMGSLASKNYEEVVILSIVAVLVITFLYLKHIELDIFSLGENEAKLAGINATTEKIKILVAITVLTGAIVSTSGIIGFIGLVSAHITRKIFYNKHKILIIASGLLGATLLILSDTIARTIMAPVELPVGAITALIGGPFFAYVFLSKGRD